MKDQSKLHEQRQANLDEHAFKVIARRNKLIGLWAAGRLGLEGAAAEAYAKEVVIADLEESGDQDVIRKLLNDFSARGVPATEAEIVETLTEMHAEARSQLPRGD